MQTVVLRVLGTVGHPEYKDDRFTESIGKGAFPLQPSFARTVEV